MVITAEVSSGHTVTSLATGLLWPRAVTVPSTRLRFQEPGMWVTLQGQLPKAGEKKRTQEPWAELLPPSPQGMLQHGNAIIPVAVRGRQRDSSGIGQQVGTCQHLFVGLVGKKKSRKG